MYQQSVWIDIGGTVLFSIGIGSGVKYWIRRETLNSPLLVFQFVGAKRIVREKNINLIFKL